MSSAITHFLDQALHSRLIVENAKLCVESSIEPLRTAIPRFETLMLILEGSLTIHYEGQVFPVQRGDLFLHPAWGLRKIAHPRNRRMRLAFVTFSTPPDMAMQTPLFLARCRDFEMEKAAMKKMADWVRQRPPLWSLLAEASLKGMMGRMVEAFLETGGTNRPPGGSNEAHAADKTLNWIRAHYRQAQVLEEAHRHGPISPRYFRGICKEKTGLSPQRLVRSLRLRAARFYLLEHKERTIAEIANEVGFDDPLYFSKVYRTHWGCAPSTERKSHHRLA